MSLLSCYILTFNSERYLADALKPISEIADDIVLLDSGSNDKTEDIGKTFNVRFLYRKFDNFKNQRTYAAQQCFHDYIMFVDSDEIIDAAMSSAIIELKRNDFVVDDAKVEGIRFKRRWFLFQQPVHAFYPVQSPDYPIRIYDKTIVGFEKATSLVHETPTGFRNEHTITDGSLDHYSCDSVHNLFNKMNQYTTLAAHDLIHKGKKSGWLRAYVHAVAAWFKWYIGKGGYKDGKTGVLLGFYAFLYTYMKYIKALFIKDL